MVTSLLYTGSTNHELYMVLHRHLPLELMWSSEPQSFVSAQRWAHTPEQQHCVYTPRCRRYNTHTDLRPAHDNHAPSPSSAAPPAHLQSICHVNTVTSTAIQIYLHPGWKQVSQSVGRLHGEGRSSVTKTMHTDLVFHSKPLWSSLTSVLDWCQCVCTQC